MLTRILAAVIFSLSINICLAKNADITGDQFVDQRDLAVVASQWLSIQPTKECSVMGYAWNDSPYVWHVSKLGNDANSGHAAQYPNNLAADSKLTINAAITAAASGDTIVVWNGVYAEAIDLVTAGKTLHIIGAGTRDQVVINPASGTALIMGDYCEAENLTAKGDVGINAQGTVQARLKNVIGWGTALAGSIDGIQINVSVNFYAEDCYFKSTWDGAVVTGAIGYNFNRCAFETLGTHPSGTHYAFKDSGQSGGRSLDCVFIFQNTGTGNTIDKAGITALTGSVFENCTVSVRTYQSIFNKIAADAWAIEGGGKYINCRLHAESDQGIPQGEWAIKNGAGASLILEDTFFAHAQDVTGTYVKVPSGDITGSVSLSSINGDTTAASNLEKSAASMVQGTVDDTAFPPTITEFECDDITDATADVFKDRSLIVTSGIYKHKPASIIASSLVNGRTHFTVTGLVGVLGNDDTIEII